MKNQKKEIMWNIVNSSLAGAIFFLGSFTGAGFKITLESIIFSFIAALLIAVIKFQDYWAKEQNEYSNKFMKLI